MMAIIVIIIVSVMIIILFNAKLHRSQIYTAYASTQLKTTNPCDECVCCVRMVANDDMILLKSETVTRRFYTVPHVKFTLCFDVNPFSLTMPKKISC